jgi:hypothetical protein
LKTKTELKETSDYKAKPTQKTCSPTNSKDITNTKCTNIKKRFNLKFFFEFKK